MPGYGFGYSPLVRKFSSSVAPSPYGTLTTAWIAATGETDLTILGALNTLETDLDTYGLTSKMTALYPFAGGTSTKHSYNFINTAAYQLSFVGGWTHSSTGSLPNGTNAYANTNLLASSFGSNYMLSFYSRTNSSGLKSDLGTYNNSIGLEIITRDSNTINIDVPSPNFRLSTTNSDSRGFYIVANNSTITRKVYKNSTEIISSSFLNVNLENLNLIFSAWGYLPQMRYSNRELAFGGFGSNFTATDATNYYTAVQRFQTTLGRQVGAPLYDNGTLLLDTYTASSAAYSASRKLRNNYDGYAIRVRHSSDNAEQDIPFTSLGVLDESALTTFVGANNGFVTTWYDQSGNGRNATQATASNQPRIVNSGTIEKIGTIPTINFVTNTWITNAASINTKSVFTVSQVSSYVQLQSLFTFPFPSTIGPWVRSISPNYYRAVSTGGLNADDYTNGNDMYFNDHLHITSDSILNKHILSSFGDKTATFQFSTQYYGRQYIGKISEGILYGTDEKSGYRTGIVGNMNTFYTVY